MEPKHVYGVYTGNDKICCRKTMTMEITALAKACGKSSVHNLEVEDLRALSFEASAFTGVKMAGIDRAYDW